MFKGPRQCAQPWLSTTFYKDIILTMATQAKDAGSKELQPAEAMDSAAEHEQPAAKAAKQETLQTSHSVHAAPESLPAPGATENISKAAASSRSSSLSPQPSSDLHDREQRAQEVPSQTTPAAQAAASAAQEGAPWQEVSRTRRKPVSQQSTLTPNVHNAIKQGSSAPDQQSSAPSRLPLREFPAAAQQAIPAPMSLQKGGRPPHAQPMQAAAEQLPHAQPGLADSAPQQPSQHQGPDPLPSVQHEPLQVTPESVPPRESHLASHHRPHPGIFSGTSSHDKVCLLAWTKLPYIFPHALQTCLKIIVSVLDEEVHILLAELL